MTPDQTRFRQAMSRLGAAVNIVTTDGPSGRHGITASAVCSVTDTPPTLLVCVNRSSSAHDMFVENGVFCVNVLGHDHADLAMQFGRPGLAPEERFESDDWITLETGAPALKSATVSLDCRVSNVETVGTHSVIMGEVIALNIHEDSQSLVYFDRNFHRLGPVPTTP
ncbi:flavin reductase [Celeribacter neptunius]|uniref:Flavin reductase n=1 Tax=Celeribacter neptunius TaxID=588602 RepID=A0A1I3Y383_9RHOB|nr:flavin reductase [Celeribacter neptunius]SFK26203.1 flavin reductase [Celeribacter neptunius]